MKKLTYKQYKARIDTMTYIIAPIWLVLSIIIAIAVQI